MFLFNHKLTGKCSPILSIWIVLSALMLNVEGNGGGEVRPVITNWNCKSLNWNIRIYSQDPLNNDDNSLHLLGEMNEDVGTSSSGDSTTLSVSKEFWPVTVRFFSDDGDIEYEGSSYLLEYSDNKGYGIWCQSSSDPQQFEVTGPSSYVTEDYTSIGGLTQNLGIKDATCTGGIDTWGYSGRYYGSDFPNGDGDDYATWVPSWDFPVRICKADVHNDCRTINYVFGTGFQVWCLGSLWWTTNDIALNCYDGCNAGFGNRQPLVDTSKLFIAADSVTPFNNIDDRKCLHSIPAHIPNAGQATVVSPCSIYEPGQAIKLESVFSRFSIQNHGKCLNLNAGGFLQWIQCFLINSSQLWYREYHSDGIRFSLRNKEQRGKCIFYDSNTQWQVYVADC
eukprot:Pgem_evm1s15154